MREKLSGVKRFSRIQASWLKKQKSGVSEALDGAFEKATGKVHRRAEKSPEISRMGEDDYGRWMESGKVPKGFKKKAMVAGFLSELQKIAAVSLSGLSPESILSQKPPEPLETLGARKALDIIEMAEAKKTASIVSPATSLRASQKVGQPVVNRAKNGPGIKQQIRGSLVGTKGTLPPI